MRRDSLDKLFHYLNNIKKAETVTISDKLHRDFSCPEGCGGCCFKVTLDYIEGSERWKKFKKLYPERVKDFHKRVVNEVEIWSDFQDEHTGNYCKLLDKNGRCAIHEASPFLCAFEPIRIIYNKGTKKTNILVKKAGRGWQYKCVDGKIGAKCEILETKNSVPNHYKLLRELKETGKKFGYEVDVKGIEG
jgi:Fe-S-cluster containining protein